MALTALNGSEAWPFGINPNISIDGIVEVTSYTIRREKTIIVEGKGSDGEFGAVLIGGEKLNISAEGYAAAEALPAAGGGITIFSIQGTVVSVECTGSNEDFVKVRVEGIGYPALQ